MIVQGSTDLKGDMLIPQPDFQLLSAVLVLFRPLTIVLPSQALAAAITSTCAWKTLLHDLALLNDPFYLVDEKGANAHYT